jgi:hypothetical protein
MSDLKLKDLRPIILKWLILVFFLAGLFSPFSIHEFKKSQSHNNSVYDVLEAELDSSFSEGETRKEFYLP